MLQQVLLKKKKMGRRPIPIGLIMGLLLAVVTVGVVDAKPLTEMEAIKNFPFPSKQGSSRRSLPPPELIVRSLSPPPLCNCNANTKERQNRQIDELVGDDDNHARASETYAFEEDLPYAGTRNGYGSGSSDDFGTNGNGNFEKNEESSPEFVNSLDEVGSNSTNPKFLKQIILIQPPPQIFRHNIGVQPKQEEEISKRPRTIIYVLPPKVQHIYNITDNRMVAMVEGKGPVVYYLGTKGGVGGHSPGDGNGSENHLELDDAPPSEEPFTNSNSPGGNIYAVPDYQMKLEPPPLIQTTESTRTQVSNSNSESSKYLPPSPTTKTTTSNSNKYLPPFTTTTTSNKYLPPSTTTTTTTTTPQTLVPTSTEGPKMYRRFNYFSPRDYEDLKSKGQLSSQNYDEEISINHPTYSENYQGAQYLPSNYPRIRMNDYSSYGPPKVNLQYQDDNPREFDYQNTNSNSGFNPNFSPYRSSPVDYNSFNSLSLTPESGPLVEDMKMSSSSSQGYDFGNQNQRPSSFEIIPALLKKYFYIGPNDQTLMQSM